MPVLVLWQTESPEEPGESIRFETAELVVGRSKACSHSIMRDLVSRKHLRIWLEGERTWKVEDLGSMNGTFLNDQRIEVSGIRPGDVIRMGPAGPTLRVLSLDPSPVEANPVTEQIALHWVRRVTERISSDPLKDSSSDSGSMLALPPPAGGPPPAVPAAEPETPTVPWDEEAAPPPKPARPPDPPKKRRRPPLRILLVTLAGAILGGVVGLQVADGLVPSRLASAPALLFGIHLVKVQAAVPTGLLLPVLMAVYGAAVFASVQFPFRGWLVLALLLILHWVATLLIRSDPSTVDLLIDASVSTRDAFFRAFAGS